jgi:hypothetical protein
VAREDEGTTGGTGEEQEAPREREHAGDCGCGCGGDCLDCENDETYVSDDVVDGVYPECCDGAGVEPYVGFLQEVPGCPGMFRLYVTLRLDDYYSFCKDDILARRKYGDRSVVFICRNRPVRRVTVGTPDQDRMDRMEGEIARGWASAAPDRRPAPGATGATTDTVWPCPQSKPRSVCPC